MVVKAIRNDCPFAVRLLSKHPVAVADLGHGHEKQSERRPMVFDYLRFSAGALVTLWNAPRMFVTAMIKAVFVTVI